MLRPMQRITPSLMFNQGAEEAVAFYLSVFPNSSLKYEERWPDGKHLASTFELNTINCDTQEEIDHYWDKLGEGGETHACGWLTDRYGVVWQVQPAWFGEKMKTGTTAQAQAMFGAMMEMVKIDMAALLQAYGAAR